MYVLFSATDSEAPLRTELAHAFPSSTIPPGVGGSFEIESEIAPGSRLPWLAFSRQLLPNARRVAAESIRGWAAQVTDALLSQLPEDQPWSLHVVPSYGARVTHRMGARAWHSVTRRKSPPALNRYTEGNRVHKPLAGQVALHHDVSGVEAKTPTPDPRAGKNRCRLIHEAVSEILFKRRRHLLRRLRAGPVPFSSSDSLVQLILTAPASGYLSVAPAPLPFEQRHLVWPFPLGEVPVAEDKSAPSRAFAKLAEAELRFGCHIQRGQTCVDLGASPGSWTWVAVNRGARVVAIDRTPLRDDLMRHPSVHFQPGDAFQWTPKRPVDWLLCDVIAPPERTTRLLLDWVRRRWCKRFVVTVKLKDEEAARALEKLKIDLPPLAKDFYLARLCANKKEVCAFGSVVGVDF